MKISLIVLLFAVVMSTVLASNDSEKDSLAANSSGNVQQTYPSDLCLDKKDDYVKFPFIQSNESVKDAALSVIHPKLRNKLNGTISVADVIMTMKNSTAPVLESIRNQKFPNQKMKRKKLVDELKIHSTRSQIKILELLKLAGMIENKHFKTYWITNQCFIKNVNLDLLTKLEKMDRSNISSIEEVRTFKLTDQVGDVFNREGDGAMIESDTPQAQWGIEKIRCPEAWDRGITGEGVVVANIDTGVRWTHEALRSSFREEYGWFDPSGETSTPNDFNGHGTHTMGTIVGSTNGVGVAPGAKWIACKGCASDDCSQSDLLACGQFMLCPTLPDGTEPDSDFAPNVISNSWAAGIDGGWYDTIIDSWNVAGIISTFASGNSGPECGCAEYPANYIKTISVASTDNIDRVSYFSSPGPTADGTMKPDLAAPGSSVLSAYHTSDTAYATLSGTSMACPHVAGVVALLLQSEPSLSNDEVRTCLTSSVVKTNPKNVTCSSLSDNMIPNYHVGAGRIDAVRSLDCVNNM